MWLPDGHKYHKHHRKPSRCYLHHPAANTTPNMQSGIQRLNYISQLRSVTCHMGSHSVTCHPTQVSTPCLNPSQTGLPRTDVRLNWPRWLVTYRDGLCTRRWSPIQVLTGPVSINYIDRSQCAKHYTMLPPCKKFTAISLLGHTLHKLSC